MSLRSLKDQTDREDEAYREFRAGLGAAREHYDRMTKDEVRHSVECKLHVARLGVFCIKAAGAFYNCRERRVAAAKLKAEQVAAAAAPDEGPDSYSDEWHWRNR